VVSRLQQHGKERLTDNDGPLAALGDRLTACRRLNEWAAVLDPDALLLAAAVLRDALPVMPPQTGPASVNVEAAEVINDLYVVRHSAFASVAEANLVNFLLMVIDRIPPGALPVPLAAEAWHLQAVVLVEAVQLDWRLDLLNTAVAMWHQVVAMTPAGQPRRPTYLAVLAAALLTRFDGSHDLADLDGAVDAGRVASAVMPADDPAKLDCLGNLANALWNRFENSGQRADIDEAIDIFQAALAAEHADQQFRLAVQRNLCGALLSRFQYSGSAVDLAAAIAAGRSAVDCSPADDPGRAVGLCNLAAALHAQYEQSGVLADLAGAVAASRDAATAVSEDDPSRAGYLSTLSMSLLTLAERTGSLADADAAVAASRAAVAAVPDGHPDRSGHLSGLGITLRERFNQTGRMVDLDEAVEVGRAAVDASPAGHPNRGGYLTNLCLALRARYERSNDPADLDASISASRVALGALAAGRPDYARVQLNLGLALATRSSADGGRRAVTEIEQARQAFEQAARTDVAEHSVRLQAAQAWGESAGELGDWTDAVRGYEEAVRLLAESAWHGLGRADQIHILARSWGLAADAAAAAVRAGQPERAVELLEQARGVLLGQAIDARSDRSLLNERAPALARQLDAVGAELDRLAAASAAEQGSVLTSPGTEPRRAARRQELAGEWDDLVAGARQIPGLSDFLRPMPFADLRRCAEGGPVVIVNFSRHGCHCLIVATAGLTVVRLDQLTLRDALGHIQNLRDALAAVDGTSGGWRRGQSMLADTLGWLWDSVTGPAIGMLAAGGHPDGPLPLVWWCPTGLAAFLPLHAAGRHGGPGTSAAVMDHVVSSYTPTLRALIDARAQAARVDGMPSRMLAVALPVTPDLPDLATAKAEVQAVDGRVPQVTVVAGQAATRASLLSELPQHNFLHFAGHAIQDSFDVVSGALYSYDGPVSISDLTTLRLADARLAFLSACQTAVGAMDVPDEAVHLAGALLLAGFSHVVATQWRISDRLALQVAEDFYSRLVHGGALDPAGAARSLHAAIQRLRRRSSPLLWAAYIHIGP
jgi:tetratricopeptide (TPR) repeat protein